MITPLFEEEHKLRSDFINSRYNTILSESSPSTTPLIEKRNFYAKLLIKNLFENMVYREDFEIDETDKASTKFANFIGSSENSINNINSKSLNGMPVSITDEQIYEIADSTADNLTVIWVDNAKQQMMDIQNVLENAQEKGIAVSENNLASKYSLFREFNYLDKVENTSTAEVAEAIITQMSPEEKMDLAIKQSAFKNCLESLGVNINSKAIADRINEEFKKSIYM